MADSVHLTRQLPPIFTMGLVSPAFWVLHILRVKTAEEAPGRINSRLLPAQDEEDGKTYHRIDENRYERGEQGGKGGRVGAAGDFQGRR
jgi:hypothetical protein